ncbi:hypothetical protein, partial [Escherichia coli]|uniref:hypothetical protein n=1 Tax=Escherichia coli TaxID=562 RepID=UPI001BC85306
KRAYCLKTQPATGETYPKSDLFNKALAIVKSIVVAHKGTVAVTSDARGTRFVIMLPERE